MTDACCSINTLFVLLCGHTCCQLCIPKAQQKCKQCGYKFFYDPKQHQATGFKTQETFVAKWQKNNWKLKQFMEYMRTIITKQESMLLEAEEQLDQNHEWVMGHTSPCDPQFALDFFLDCETKVAKLNTTILENMQFLKGITAISNNFNVFLTDRTKETKADYTVADQSFSKVLLNATHGFTLVVYTRFNFLNQENIPFENILMSKYNFCITSESLVLNKI